MPASDSLSRSTPTGRRPSARLPSDSGAALSGLLWAILAYSVAHEVLGVAIWGGVLSSPLIGIVVGRLFHPFEYSKPRFLLGSLASLYVAVGLFGLATGMTGWMLNESPKQSGPALVVQTLLGCVGGITLTGFVLAFWPLSALNHWLLHRARKS
jgi:hypothetical protein